MWCFKGSFQMYYIKAQDAVFSFKQILEMLRHCLILFSVIVTLVQSFHFNETIHKTVGTHSGPVRGRLDYSLWKQKYYFAFRGIPYAKPPVGKLRFKAPEPIEPWKTTIDTFEYAPACPQFDGEINFSDTKEDCLFLNIFVPGD